ncbi:MAG: hypothetical protein QXM92_04065 [Candidatus Anstonellales archaeon]
MEAIPESGFHKSIANQVKELGIDPISIANRMRLDKYDFSGWKLLPAIAYTVKEYPEFLSELEQSKGIIDRIKTNLNPSSKINNIRFLVNLYKNNIEQADRLDEYLKIVRDDKDLNLLEAVIKYELKVTTLEGMRKIEDFELFYGKLKKYLTKDHISDLISRTYLDYKKLEEFLNNRTFRELVRDIHVNDRLKVFVAAGQVRNLRADKLIGDLEKLIYDLEIPSSVVLSWLHFLDSIKDWQGFVNELYNNIVDNKTDVRQREEIFNRLVVKYNTITPRYEYERD